ncbi:unannotated protein [freshwater metagenome]|uniref:Unannotated protein n=1 Tax=freshwater metagenome TaxID=449393 RepID=A0A6J7DR64_9ZZZZ
MVSKDFGDFCELPGAVRKRNPHSHVTPCRDKTAGDDAFHQHRIDVSSRQDNNGLPDRIDLFGENCGHTNRARRFDDEFGTFEKHDERARDVVIADGDNLVDGVLDDGEIQGTGSCDGNSIRDGWFHLDGCRFTGL